MRRFFVGDDDDDDLSGIALGDDDDDDEMGLEEILAGDDLEDILGAHRRRRRRSSKRRALQNLALARQAGAFVTRKRNPTDARIQTLPFDNTPIANIAAGAAQNLTASPQRMIKPTRLVIPSRDAPNILVTNFTIGAEPQFPQTGAMSGQMFSEVGVSLSLRGRTMNLGSTATLSVTNIGVAAITNFAPAILGEVVM